MSTFSRQLHVLVSSGTPMVQALTAIERQTDRPSWKRALSELRTRVEEGESLSVAMERQPECFDSVCRSLIAAGESSGKLAPMLQRLSELSRKQLHRRNAIGGAMVYPCVLVGIGVCVLVGMLLFVLPRFRGLFQTLGVPIPPTTKALLFASDILKNYWWALLMVLIGGGMGIKAWLATPQSRRVIDTMLLKAPKLGKLTRSLATAQIARMLGVLIEGQVPLLEALALTRQGISNSHYVTLLTSTEDAVSRGESMSSCMSKGDLLSPSVCEAMRNGEESGQVGPLLVNMADFLDEENEVVVKATTSIIEPLILVMLGVLVGFIAISMFLPLFDLAAMGQGG